MNVSRLVASVGGYFYSTGADELAVHLYGGTATTVDVAGTQGPCEGGRATIPGRAAIKIAIDPETPAEFALKLRIPGWVARGGDALASTAQPVDVAASSRKGYVAIRRTWSKGDAVALDLPMPAERVYANPNVRQDVGRVALKRGPFVYCAEQVDNPTRPGHLDQARPPEQGRRGRAAGPVRRHRRPHQCGHCREPRRLGVCPLQYRAAA